VGRLEDPVGTTRRPRAPIDARVVPSSPQSAILGGGCCGDAIFDVGFSKSVRSRASLVHLAGPWFGSRNPSQKIAPQGSASDHFLQAANVSLTGSLQVGRARAHRMAYRHCLESSLETALFEHPVRASRRPRAPAEASSLSRVDRGAPSREVEASVASEWPPRVEAGAPRGGCLGS
jgi:hypothetical protein